jgi:FAD/FMN-containing dehydrogenase
MLMTKTTDINSFTIKDFRAHLRGQLLSRGDDGYDSARRVWNGTIDKYPALIVKCAEVSDVISTIRFVHNQRLTVAVRSGGHSVAGQGCAMAVS